VTGWPWSSGEIVRDPGEHLLSGLPLGSRSGFDGTFADGDGVATDRGASEPTASQRQRECDQARPPEFIPLLEGESMAVIGRREAKEDAGEGVTHGSIARSLRALVVSRTETKRWDGRAPSKKPHI
jgi:hypothetical protein